MINEVQIPLNIKVGDQEFVAVEHWWEDNDFIFLTESGQEYRCPNVYPISIKYDGLDSSSDEEVTITITKRYDVN